MMRRRVLIKMMEMGMAEMVVMTEMGMQVEVD